MINVSNAYLVYKVSFAVFAILVLVSGVGRRILKVGILRRRRIYLLRGFEILEVLLHECAWLSVVFAGGVFPEVVLHEAVGIAVGLIGPRSYSFCCLLNGQSSGGTCDRRHTFDPNSGCATKTNRE